MSQIESNLKIICEKIQQNVPSVDFGNDSDSDGDVEIYHRPIGCELLDDEDRDVDETLPEKHDTEIKVEPINVNELREKMNLPPVNFTLDSDLMNVELRTNNRLFEAKEIVSKIFPENKNSTDIDSSISLAHKSSNDTVELNDKTSKTILEQLADISKCVEVDGNTGVMVKKLDEIIYHPIKKQTTCSGTNTNDLKKITNENRNNYSSERLTRKIDLRNNVPEKITGFQKPIFIPESTSSDSSDSDHSQELWLERRRRLKSKQEHLQPKMNFDNNILNQRKPTTDVQLLTDNLTKSNNIIKQDIVINQDTIFKTQTNIVSKSINETKSVYLNDELPNAKVSVKQSNSKQLKKLHLREEILRERNLKQQLNESLLKIKELCLSNDCLDTLPILLNFNTSFSDKYFEALPPENIIKNTEVVQLQIFLSEPETISLQIKANEKGADINLHPVNYYVLLSYFLSLVPDKYETILHGSDDDDFCQPFYVIGLQQILVDGEFSLNVAVVPNKIFEQKDTSIKTKRKKHDTKNETQFQHYLNTILSKKTLINLCPWLENLHDGCTYFHYSENFKSISSKPLSSFVKVSGGRNIAQQYFNLKPSFFPGVIVNHVTNLHHDQTFESNIQNAVCILPKNTFSQPKKCGGIFLRILSESLDLTAIRLMYKGKDEDDLEQIEGNCAIAIAVRGKQVLEVWKNAIGPMDAKLAIKTDPNSLSALFYVESKTNLLLFFPKSSELIHGKMCRWFGPKVMKLKSKNDVQKIIQSVKKDNDEISEVKAHFFVSSVTSEAAFIISPFIYTRCIGLILTIICNLGFEIKSIGRKYLSLKQFKCLGITDNFLSSFAFSSTIDDLSKNKPITIICIQKENIQAHLDNLLTKCINKLAIRNITDSSNKYKLESRLLFKCCAITNGAQRALINELNRLPKSQLVFQQNLILPRISTDPESEEIVLVALIGIEMFAESGKIISDLLQFTDNIDDISSKYHGFELIGIKSIQKLNQLEARNLTPYSPGHKYYEKSISCLCKPAIILLLRGENAYKRLFSKFGSYKFDDGEFKEKNLKNLVSPRPEVTCTYSVLFFSQEELIEDNTSRPLLAYLPKAMHFLPIKTADFNHVGYKEDILKNMCYEPQKIFTVVIAKPEVLEKNLLGKLIISIIDSNFDIVGCVLRKLSSDEISLLEWELKVNDYDKDDNLQKLGKRLDEKPCVIFCLQRVNAVHKLLRLVGNLNPVLAAKINKESWRAKFGTDIIENGLYCSEDFYGAQCDMKGFFPNGLCGIKSFDSDFLKITIPSMNNEIGYGPSITRTITYISKENNFTQINCLVIPPCLVSPAFESEKSMLGDIIDLLDNKRFKIVGMKMFNFTKNQAEEYLKLIKAGDFKKVDLLTERQSVVLAIERDHAITTFEAAFGGRYQNTPQSLYNRCFHHLMFTTTTNAASNHLKFFFDRLERDAIANISVNENVL